MKYTLGRSVDGRAIDAFVFAGSAKRTVLVLGGFHGDEPKGVYLARRLIDLQLSEPKPQETCWVIMPLVNPDGYERRKRRNARDIDINRNFPTKNWAPGAAQSHVWRRGSGQRTGDAGRDGAVKRFRPSRILTIHSIGADRHCNNYDGPARDLAYRMRRLNRYPVAASIGYPTPGSFGTWAGVERNIPTITLELPSRHSAKRCWEDNREALLCAARWS